MMKQIFSQWHNMTEEHGRFLTAGTNYEEAQAVLLGLPMDYTVSYQPGSRFGPGAIRRASVVLEEYSPDLDGDLKDSLICDLGDLALPIGNVAAALELIGKAARQLFADGKFPIFLGGEHLVSFPVIREAYTFYPDLAVLHLDAHADLRTDYLGEPFSHATVMRKVAELIGPNCLYQLGIRSGSREEWAFGRTYTHMYPNAVLEPLQGILPELQGRPVYISLDIDVADPAFAPGTGTQEPGGCSSNELLAALRTAAALNVVGLDVVEVCPALDFGERTAILAAKLVREALIALVSRR